MDMLCHMRNTRGCQRSCSRWAQYLFETTQEILLQSRSVLCSFFIEYEIQNFQLHVKQSDIVCHLLQDIYLITPMNLPPISQLLCFSLPSKNHRRREEISCNQNRHICRFPWWETSISFFSIVRCILLGIIHYYKSHIANILSKDFIVRSPANTWLMKRLSFQKGIRLSHRDGRYAPATTL